MDSSVKSFLAFRKIWSNAQRPMTEITRWSQFPEYGQTLTEHSNSVPLVGWWVTSHVAEDADIDVLLVLTALMVHDHGEPLNGGDVIYDLKQKSDDLFEWQAFRSLVNDHNLSPFSEMIEKAFLLQFCRNTDIRLFTVDVQERIRTLQETYPLEAATFEFVERIDYFLSASVGRDEGIKNDDETMIGGTFRNQTQPMEALVTEFPVFEKIWTPELRAWLKKE